MGGAKSWRATSAFAVLALVGSFLASFVSVTQMAASAQPSAACSWNGAPSVTAGETITVGCTGLQPSALYLSAEASPLAAITTTGGLNEVDVNTLNQCTATLNGTCAFTFTVPSTFTATDPNAVCPPTQAQANVGLPGCLLAVAPAATSAPGAVVVLNYTGHPNPTPQAPSAPVVTPTTGVAGDSLTVADTSNPFYSGTGSNTYWWGAADTGSPFTGTPSVPAPLATVGGITATSNLTVSPAVYAYNSTTPAFSVLTPPRLSGTITVPSGVETGSGISITEPNTLYPSTPGNANYGGAGAGTGVTAVSSSTWTQLGSATTVLNPTAGTPGALVVDTGNGWDPEGGLVSCTSSPSGISYSATVSLDGTWSASFSVPLSASAGLYTITCTQTTFNNSTLSALESFIVFSLPTATTLSSSLDPANPGQSVTYTASVTQVATGGSVTVGSVTFFDGTVPICSAVPLSSTGTVSCTHTYTTVGNNTITATYSGSGPYAGSVSLPLGETVISTTNCSITPSTSTKPTSAKNCNLSGANLENANLVNENFQNCVLTGANLSGANLSGANLKNVNLSGANLTGANLSSANLKNANLSGANLTGANLTGATNLSSANLTGVIWSNTTCPDGTNSNNDGGTCLGHL